MTNLERVVRVLLLGFLLGTTTSCNQQELLYGLDQRQSIEALVYLHRAGIRAERVQQGSGRSQSYQIVITKSQYDSALEVLHEYDVPQAPEVSFEEMLSQRGAVPNIRELEQLRIDYLLSKQIEYLLSELPGVINVASNVRTNLESLGGVTENNKPTASVVIRFASETQRPPFDLARVKTMVLNSVPGLSEDLLSVEMARVKFLTDSSAVALNGENGAENNQGLSAVYPFNVYVPEAELAGFERKVVAVILLCILCGGIVGFNLRRLKKSSRVNAGWKLTGKPDVLIESSSSDKELS